MSALTTEPTIELPRIEGESAQAYRARVEYVTMGAGRSIDKLTDQQGRKRGSKSSRSTTLLEWSRKYGWVESARQYDDQIAYITLEQAQQQYSDDLKDYRKRYGDMGKQLFLASGQMLNIINKKLKLGDVEVGPGALTLIVNAAKAAADLEALALRVEGLLSEGGREDAR